MTRRYRRNENLIPPADAYSQEEWALIEQFAASGERVVATDIGQWPDGSGENDYYMDAGGTDDDELYSAEYLYPRRPPLTGGWDEAEQADGVWLVYFTALQSPNQKAARLWDGIENRSNYVDDYGGAPMSKAYLFRGTGEEAEEFASAVRAASLDWLQDEGGAVARSGATDEHSEYEYVTVYDDGGPEDLHAEDCRMVVLQDTVFGWWWYKSVADNYSDSDSTEGPYESESAADRAAERAAENADDRRRDERGMSADQVYQNRQPEQDEGPPRERIEPENDLAGVLAIIYQPKSKQLLSVHYDGDTIIRFNGDKLGKGYFDNESAGHCARTHTPHGVSQKGGGYGMALYTALGTVAFQVYELGCIGSCPTSDAYGSRSSAANAWWAAAVERGIARPYDEDESCAYITMRTLIGHGLVFWMVEPGSFEGALREAQEKYAAAFAAAEPDPDPEILNVIGEELKQILASEDFEAWRVAHGLRDDAEEATPNRRGGRRGKRKPAFVTPELEAHVEALYEGLEGL